MKKEYTTEEWMQTESWKENIKREWKFYLFMLIMGYLFGFIAFFLLR